MFLIDPKERRRIRGLKSLEVKKKVKRNNSENLNRYFLPVETRSGKGSELIIRKIIIY